MKEKYTSTSIHVRPSNQTLRKRIEAAAAANNRSLAAEIEMRLVQSFENDIMRELTAIRADLAEIKARLK